MNHKIGIPQLRFQEFDGEWETNKLSDWKLKVIDGDRGTNYPNGDDFSPEGYCLFMNAKNVTKNGFSFDTKMFITKEKDEKLRKGKLKRNDLILTTRGSVGNIAFYDDSIKFENLRINSGMVLIRNENSKIDSRFIYSSFFTPKLNRIIDTISFGSAQPQLTVKEINLFKFNIPTLPEQQKIASFLSAVYERIQQLSRKKELLEQYKKGLMQQLFSGKLRFKDKNGNDYADWEEKKLGDLVKIKSGNSPSDYNFIEDGVNPFIKVEELNNCSKYQNKSRFYSNDHKNLIESFSVIFPKRGAAILNNKVRINDCPIIMDSNMMALIPLRKELDVEFLYSKIVMAELYKIADTSSIPQINNKHIEPYVISTPCLKEQQKIANFLSSIDTKIKSTNQQINQTQSFKKGLLQQLFV